MSSPTPPPFSRQALTSLLLAHSTPGDEAEVADLLMRSWEQGGLQCRRHGRFAVSAAAPSQFSSDRPTVLVCAHMDSPGYIVEAVVDGRLRMIPLGGPHFDGDATPVVIKTGAGTFNLNLRRESDAEGADLYFGEQVEGAAPGDRACFAAEPDIREDGIVSSPFLDNRLGCLLLHEFGQKLRERRLPETVNWVLGATACEEMGGFGAPVFARAVQPDMVFCVDATYEAHSQHVRIGEGPVLTLSDASVLLSPDERDRILSIAANCGAALQTEVYNFSGTDARAFPQAGLPAPVHALLIPSAGNHTPTETASLHDWQSLLSLIPALAVGLGET